MRRGIRWIAILSFGAAVAGCAGATDGQVGSTSSSDIQRSITPSTADSAASGDDAAGVTGTTVTTTTALASSTSTLDPPDPAVSGDDAAGVTGTTVTVTTTTAVASSTSTLDPPETAELGADGTALASSAVDGLLWMREEEKLARDVYRRLSELWDLPIFANIADSEQAHTDAVADLLVLYDIPDPMADDVPGVFVEATIQSLYDDLVEQGSKSLVDALIVGATIEEMDIVDLQLRRSGVAAVDEVYAHLEKGSRNHLRAFIRTLERQGGEYAPSFLGVDAYEAIINSPVERGPAGA